MTHEKCVGFAGLPLLTAQKSCPTTTVPSTLSLCHAFIHLYLMRGGGDASYGWFDYALVPMDGSEGARFVRHWRFYRYLSIFVILPSMEWPRAGFNQNSLVFIWMKPKKSFPSAYAHEERNVITSESGVHVQHKIWILPQPTNWL